MQPLLEGRVDAILAGDSNRVFASSRWAGIPVHSVGMSREPYPVFFTVGTVDAKGRLRLEPVPLDVPADHPWRQRPRACD